MFQLEHRDSCVSKMYGAKANVPEHCSIKMRMFELCYCKAEVLQLSCRIAHFQDDRQWELSTFEICCREVTSPEASAARAACEVELGVPWPSGCAASSPDTSAACAACEVEPGVPLSSGCGAASPETPCALARREVDPDSHVPCAGSSCVERASLCQDKAGQGIAKPQGEGIL